MNLTDKVSTVRYSPGERKLFSLLTDKPMSSEALSEKFYRGHKEVPFHGRKIVIGLVTSIQKKVNANKEKFQIMKSDRKGPHPIEVWIERKK